MPKLYVITGPAGVGKSTISKKLANNLSKSALIEGDDIYHQVVGGYVAAWKPNNHLSTFWNVCLDIINRYLLDGYDVVFNYIITLENIENIKNRFKSYDIKFVVLMVNENTLLLRDSSREEDCQMKERCIILLNEFKEEKYNINNILDTTNLSVDKTLDIIKTSNDFYL